MVVSLAVLTADQSVVLMVARQDYTMVYPMADSLVDETVEQSEVEPVAK